MLFSKKLFTLVFFVVLLRLQSLKKRIFFIFSIFFTFSSSIKLRFLALFLRLVFWLISLV